MAEAERTQMPDEPLTPIDVKAPSYAERARTRVSTSRAGALATLTSDGFPYASYVTFAADEGGNPLLLMSTLAVHTQSLQKEPKCSLLIYDQAELERDPDGPLASMRLTLLGTMERLTLEHGAEKEAYARERFLAAHPSASKYAGFKDFAFWRMTVRRVRYIGGFGQIAWIDADAYQAASIDPLADHCAGIVSHMNEDHADAVVAYARAFTRATGAERAVMTACDQYGFEMNVTTENRTRPARVAFDSPVRTSDEARRALIALLKQARGILAARTA